MTRAHTYLAAVALWLGLLEGLAARAGLAGLSWGGGRVGPLLGLGLAARARPGAGALLATLPAAAAAQVGLATLRRRRLNPKLQLRPGSYRDRAIARVALEAAHGAVPALHIVPSGGARAAVCVAHGSGCDKSFYAWRLTDALVGHGLAVLLVDLDGHGESPRAQAYPEIVASVAGPAHWLRARYERVGLLGMSLGGAVTARAAAAGAPCDALVLWAAPPRLRLSAEEYRRVQIVEGLRIARPTLLHLFRDGSPQHVVQAWQTSGIRAQIGTWDLFEALDLLGSLARVAERGTERPPLLLYYAGRDAVLHPGSAEEVRRETAGWGELRVVRGASHVSLAIEPEVIAGTVEWLAARLADG
jgi:pimeloyl-ACP methyl ester carboxylesterase